MEKSTNEIGHTRSFYLFANYAKWSTNYSSDLPNGLIYDLFRNNLVLSKEHHKFHLWYLGTLPYLIQYAPSKWGQSNLKITTATKPS